MTKKKEFINTVKKSVESVIDHKKFEGFEIFEPHEIGEKIAPQGKSVVLWEVAENMLNGDQLKLPLNMGQPVAIIDGDLDDLINFWKSYPQFNFLLARKTYQFEKQLISLLTHMSSHEATEGIKAYLKPGAQIFSQKFLEYGLTKNYIEQIKTCAEKLDSFDQLPVAAATVAWELIMNAMFDAPYDFVKMQPKYSNLPRTTELVLQESEAIEVSYGFDDKLFVVAVKDNFGMLRKETMIQSLTRASRQDQNQIKRESASAGVGLYMLLNATNQLDFYVREKHYTQVIAVIHRHRRMREFEMGGKAINYFSK